jgi:hypothetical protein
MDKNADSTGFGPGKSMGLYLQPSLHIGKSLPQFLPLSLKLKLQGLGIFSFLNVGSLLAVAKQFCKNGFLNINSILK